MGKAILALHTTGVRLGFVAAYPGGETMVGEMDDPVAFLDLVDSLLQNGLSWSVLVADPEHLVTWARHVPGAVWYLAVKHGADFTVVPHDHSDAGTAAIQHAGLWRRAMPAANSAARIILPHLDRKEQP